MQEILLQEGFLPYKVIDLILKEEFARRFKFLPSEVDRESYSELMMILHINNIRAKGSPDLGL